MSQPSIRDYITIDRQALERLDRKTNDEVLSKSVEEWIGDLIASFASSEMTGLCQQYLDRRRFPFIRGSRRLPHQEKGLCSFDVNRFQLLRNAEGDR
jgi:hypothetical protein